MERNKNIMYLSLASCAIAITVLALVFSWVQIKGSRQSNGIISVEGTASISTPPNIALITITIKEEAKKTANAQKSVEEKATKAIKKITELGIDIKDIKTENYNTYPKYNYPQVPICISYPCDPKPKPMLTGYEVNQIITIKVKNIDIVGDVLEMLGKLEINEISGPNFIVDDLEKSKEQARAKAIENARIKARELAIQLGVKLIRITSFSEQNGGYQPKMMIRAVMAEDVGRGITPGENKITSNVTITYEIE